MSTLDRHYDGPFAVIRRERINAYRIDFRDQFPLRYDVINVDKLIQFLNRETGSSVLPLDIKGNTENEKTRGG